MIQTFDNELTKSQARQIAMAQARLNFVMLYIDIGEASGDPDSKILFPNQYFCINDSSLFQATEKGRQEGHSFAYAADSIARAVTEPKSQSVHISTDKWEAQKKQIYARRILECVHRQAKPYVRLLSESKERLEFANGSIIDFLACRPPRGADRASIYLDEVAFMPNVESILKAALGCTTHGGYLRVASTHCGANTEFFKMVRNAADEYGNYPYKSWNRGSFPWWTCPALCVDIERASLEAPNMPTRDRVEKFGKENIKALYAGYPNEEDFQEEFECVVLDEAHSFFSMDLIRSCLPPNGMDEWFEWVNEEQNRLTFDTAKDTVRLLAREIRNNKLYGDWLMAIDIGKHKDLTEISIGNDFNNAVCMRLLISIGRKDLYLQEDLIRFILDHLPITKGHIDATRGSMGEQMAEQLGKTYGQRVMPFEFTIISKSMIANDMKIRMQRGGLIIPQPIPRIIRQLHSIKKRVTTGNHEVFDVESNEHHGDVAWSLMMMATLGTKPQEGHATAIVSSKRQHRYDPNKILREAGIIVPQYGYGQNVALHNPFRR